MRRSLLCFSAAALSLFFTAAAAQDAPTGTRINSQRVANSINVIKMNKPDEIEQIERLLVARKTEEAFERASRYVEEVDRAALDPSTRYFAHNALCVVYTQMREYEKAFAECDLAIELVGSYWSAWNNRGTLHFIADDFEAAKQDYQLALSRVGRKSGNAELVRHNLELADFNIRAMNADQP